MRTRPPKTKRPSWSNRLHIALNLNLSAPVPTLEGMCLS